MIMSSVHCLSLVALMTLQQRQGDYSDDILMEKIEKHLNIFFRIGLYVLIKSIILSLI